MADTLAGRSGNAMLALPPHAPFSRMWWSVAAGTLILIWMVYLFGGASVPFNTPMTFGQVLWGLMRPEPRWIWPGEFGHHLLGAWVQIGPWLALLLWPLCLVRWKSRSATACSLLTILLIPAGLALIAFPILWMAPLGGFKVLWGAHDGETWEDSFADVTGMALWVWFILFLALLTAASSRRKHDHICIHCGYSTIGLPTSICPECGNTIPSTFEKMPPIIASNLDRLRDLCRKHRVKALWLFGSGACDDFDPARSDLDFLVEFEPLAKGERADTYFELHEDLERLFGGHVDLVTAPAVRNRYFAASVNHTRIPLYAAA